MPDPLQADYRQASLLPWKSDSFEIFKLKIIFCSLGFKDNENRRARSQIISSRHYRQVQTPSMAMKLGMRLERERLLHNADKTLDQKLSVHLYLKFLSD